MGALAHRERILARVEQLLLDATPAGNRVARSRKTAVTKDNAPAIGIRYDGEECRRTGDGLTTVMTLWLPIFVRGDPWDQLAATVDVPMHAALMTDAQLAQLVANIERIGAVPEDADADVTAGVLNVRYRVTYLTSRLDITRAPV